MRKLILTAVLAATALPGIASAQDARDWHHDRRELRDDRRELRRDRREVARDRRDLRGARVGYVAPYGGWRYQPVTIGYQLRPGFYGQRYWISDYGRYHLAAPRPNLRWVRYGNDLLLVNVRNGRVLQVRRSFGW
jgi:Ni/Co efflux regulator RcnB